VIVSYTAPVPRAIINNYLKRSRINITPAHEADHVTMGISLIMSTHGVGLLPAYAQSFLPPSVTSRPLKGDVPTVDLVSATESRTSLRSSSFCLEIGRVGCSGVEEDGIKLVSHIVDMAVRRLALRSEDSAISSATNKSFRIPIAHPILSLRSFSRISGGLDRGG
jgi:hypothetical protein